MLKALSGRNAGSTFVGKASSAARILWYSRESAGSSVVQRSSTRDRVMRERTLNAGSGAVVDILSFEGAGASATVVMGGTVANAGVSDGALITVSKGGLAKDIDLSGGDTAEEFGFLNVKEGGSASGITVSSGGCLTTDDGSFLTRAFVFGGQVNVGGSATKVTLYDSMNVTGWGVVTKAKVAEGGSISIFNAGGVGSVLDSEIQSGGSILNAGLVSGIQVKDGGILKTFDSGIANATEVQSGGIFIVSGIDATACDLSLVEGSTVTVTDVAGRTLLREALVSDSQQLGISDLPAGTYFVTLATKEGTSTRKLVVE